MFHFVVELITHATSNHLFVFIFCNSIIVVVLVASKSGSGSGRADGITLPLAVDTRSDRGDEMLRDVDVTSNLLEAAGSNDEENGNSSNKNDGGHGDQLRKDRFTAMQRKRWVAEALRSSRLVLHGTSGRTCRNGFGSNFQEAGGSDEEEDGNSSNKNGDENEDHSNGDELRRRSDRFIAMQHKRWKAETL